MPTRRHFVNQAPQQTLNVSITSGATSCVINGSFAGWPAQFPYFASLDYGTASAEIVSVTNVVGTTATIVRAQDGTAAVSHAAGATLDQVMVSLDLDEANAHTTASAGVHGISGSVVGTSDSQTLSNKTLTAPIMTGTATGAALTLSGTLTGVAATLSGAVSTGALTPASEAVTGASTAASYTANGNGAVTGVVVPKTYTNEAAAVTALGTPPTGTQVWLTTPTYGGAGLYTWNGTAWVPSVLAGVIGDVGGGTNVTLSTTSAFASTVSTTITLPAQRRIRMDVNAIFTMLTGTSGRYILRASYNTGASVVIGSAVSVGQPGVASVTVTGSSSGGAPNCTAFGTVLLAAGQYTFYASVQRSGGGGTTDIASNFDVLVTDFGSL